MDSNHSVRTLVYQEVYIWMVILGISILIAISSQSGRMGKYIRLLTDFVGYYSHLYDCDNNNLCIWSFCVTHVARVVCI